MSKMDYKNIFNIIKENKEYLKSFGLIKIGIFGSYARGDNREDSDVDLILEFSKEKKNFHNYMEVCDTLERVINKKIDIINQSILI